MGIYNRDYIREERPGGFGGMSGEQWAIKYLIIANVVVFLLQNVTTQYVAIDATTAFPVDRTAAWLSLNLSHLQSGQVWRLLTYGFCHGSFQHILFNMFGLWMFGRIIEPILGSREFIAFYLGGVIVSGLSHVALQAVKHDPAGVIGASGGVMALVCLTAATFPKAKAFGLIDLWVVAIIYVLLDLRSVLNPDGSGVSHIAHLGGAAFGVAYKYYSWRLSPLWQQLTGRISNFRRRRKNPNVRIFTPPSEPINDRVDGILQKIHEQGEASLTDEEREVLKEASRRLNQR